MAWKNVIGKPISTAENSSTIPGVSQRFRLPTSKPHSLMQGVGLALVFHAATYTDLTVELWADRDGSPSKLIATSQTSWTQAEVDAELPLSYKLAWLGFEFTPVPLRKGVWYHIALRATGYTGDNTNHIAWVHQYPDPVYDDDLAFTVEAKKAGVMPLFATIFAAEF